MKTYNIMRAYGHDDYEVEVGYRTIRAAKKALRMWSATYPTRAYYIVEVQQ